MNFDYFYNRQSEMYNFIRLPMVLMEDEILRAFLLKLKFCIHICLIEWVFHIKMAG